MEQTKGRRLLLFPLPLQGHINPILELAQILYSKGFSITIIHTTFNLPNYSNYPHFTFYSFPDGLSQTESSASDLLHFITLLNTKSVKPFRECLTKLLFDASDDPFACLISDAICYFTQTVAKSLGLPRIVLRTSGLSSFLVFAAFPLLREKSYFPVQDSRLEESVQELPSLRVKDLPVINTKKNEEYYKLVCDLVNETMASSGVVWNSLEELESSALQKLGQKFSIPMFSIGPFHKYFPSGSCSSSYLTPDQTWMPWLDKQAPNSVVYVSFGSLAAIAENEFLEIAWGLANSKHPFLWVVRPRMIGGSEWLEALPSGYIENLGGRGHFVKWAPQLRVLADPAVGAFWTHSGWNSTMESICEGIPMICMPRFTDQKVNARYVSHVWKVGLQLEKGLERGEIERTVKILMEGNERKEIRERSSRLKEEAKLCMKQGGSSYPFLDSLVSHILTLESFQSQAR